MGGALVENRIARMRQHLINAPSGHDVAAQEQTKGPPRRQLG
jgi:hypothetical protein